MTVMWTASGAGYFLVIFLTKQFEGNLFLNFYLDGLAGMLGYLVALPIYRCCKIRWTFVLGFGAALFWAGLLLIFQQGYADTKWIEDLGAPPCDAPDGSKEARDHDLRVIVPIIVFCLKFCQAIIALALFTASFNEDAIYPHHKRATSTGLNDVW